MHPVEHDSARSRIRTKHPLKVLDRPRFATLTAVGLCLVTLFLVWETDSLKHVDLDPHITISDVELEMIDTSGTPVKERTWSQGEILNKNALKDQVSQILVSIKFSNSGKQSGYAQLSNYLGLAQQVGSETVDPLEAFDGKPGMILVPGSGESGWAYTLNMMNLLNVAPAQLHYIVETYDIEGNKIGETTFFIICGELVEKPPYRDVACELSHISFAQNSFSLLPVAKWSPVSG
jgi:hypothetical protein